MSKILKIKDNIDLKELEKFGWSLVDDTENNCKYYYQQSDVAKCNDGTYLKFWFEYIVMVNDFRNFKAREIATFRTLGDIEEEYLQPTLKDEYLQKIKEFIEEIEVN